MTNLINTITATVPENLGYFLVGVVATLCVAMAIKLGGLAVEVWRDCREEGEEI